VLAGLGLSAIPGGFVGAGFGVGGGAGAGAGAGAGLGVDSVLATTVATTAAATTGTITLSAVDSGANVTLDFTLSISFALFGNTLSAISFTLSGSGSSSITDLGSDTIERTDLSLPSGSSPIAAFIESGIGARFTTLTKKLLIVLVGAFIKTITAPKIPTIPTATPPRMVAVLLDAATAASPAVVKLADVVGDDVVVGNGVNINRGVEVTDKNVGLAEAEIENHDTDGVDVFVPVKLKAIVPDQEILVDSVAFGDQDPVPVPVPVPVRLVVPVPVPVPVRVVVPVPVRVVVPVPVPVGKTEKVTL